MIQTFNYAVTRLYDVIMTPFRGFNEFWGMLVISSVMSLVILLLYKYLSSPSAIVKTKNQIKANILAIRLYKDFWDVIALSFLKSLYYTAKYFTLNFGPVLVILPVLFPIYAQMDAQYGMRPFAVGEEIVVTSSYLQNPVDLSVQLQENSHFKPAMNPVFINAFLDEENTQPIREVSWKLTAQQNGVTALQIKVKDAIFEKSLVIGDFKGALSNKKFRRSNAGHFLYPVEPLFQDAGTLDVVSIRYPGRNMSVLGIEMHWIFLNLLMVCILVLAFHKRFGVEF